MSTASKVRLATDWMDGCSGCHMSLLDLDQRLIDILSQFDLVYSPLVDTKEYPPRHARLVICFAIPGIA